MRSIVIGTAGHIDHGKSALVRALTGTDPDRLKEEQERGITIDLGFAHLETNGVNLAFVDVPGHERFVKNMLAGAGGIDLVMLVVAADESVMPQTREHFHICRLLGVPAGVIVLTKADLVDRDTIELATLETRELIQGSFLEDAPIIGVSSKTGLGLDSLREALLAQAARVASRGTEGCARLPVDRVFTVRGFGTVVTGTLVAGAIEEEQELELLPAGRPVKVRGQQVHGQRVRRAEAGQRVALNLGGVEVSDIARGDTLGEPGALEPTRRLDVSINLLSDGRPLRHGSRVRFHQGTAELLGRVAIAGPRRGEGGNVDIQPGASAYARIRLESSATVTRGDRFILRAYSPPVTIGGGLVLDPHPPRGPIRTPAGLARFRNLDLEQGSDRAVITFVDERGGAGLHRAALVHRAGLSRAAAAALSTRLSDREGITVVGNLLVSPAVIQQLGARLLATLEAHHRDQPLSEGMPREEIRERLFGRAAPDVFDFVLGRLVSEQRLVARDRLALQGHQVSLSPEEARAREALERIYREARLAPPDLTSAAAAGGTTTAVADRVVKLLVRSRTLVKIDTLVFHAAALDELKRDIRSLKTGEGVATVDVARFKERYGITRKYAIPLLEYLDRERITRRVGDSRVVL